MVLHLDMWSIAMLIEAITLAALLSRRPAEPVVTCHQGTVSYRFVGEPGTTFLYEGDLYSVPKSGSIELIGHGGAREYQVADRKLPLEVWPMDQFGTRTVPLPKQPSAPSLDVSR